MHSVKHLSEKKIKEDLLEEFLTYMNEELAINEPYSVFFVDDKDNASEALGKTAMYNPSTKSVYVYVTNRHPKDIMRSIAHELVHHKQHCNGDLENMSLEKAEVEANAGGYYLRKFEDGRESVNEQKTPKYREGNFPQFSANAGLFEKEVRAGCKSGYKPMKIGPRGQLGERACVPADIANKFPGFPLSSIAGSDLQQKELKILANDINKRGKKSPFITKLVNHDLTNAILANEIVLKDIKTLNNISGAFKPDENYVTNRAKYLKKIETYKKELNKFFNARQGGAQKIKPPKFPKRPKNFRLFSKSEIESATRIYFLLKDGVVAFPGRTTRGSDIIGQGIDWLIGGDVNNFGRAYKVPEKRMQQYRGMIPKKDSEKADAIFGVNFSSDVAITYGGKDIMADPTRAINDYLDVIGTSPDSFGIGVAADVINAYLYFLRFIAAEQDNLKKGTYNSTDFLGIPGFPTDENFYNALISIAGITIFGDTLKIERGPLAKAVRSWNKFTTKVGSGIVRLSDIAYLKTIEPLFNAMADFARLIRDAGDGWFKATSKTAEFVGVSPAMVKKIQKLLKTGGDSEWFKDIIKAAQKARILLKAYEKALSDSQIAIAKKMNGAWAEGILRLINDDLLKKVLKKWFTELVEKQKELGLITLTKEYDTVAKVAEAMANEAMATQALKARYVQKIFSWLLSPEARKLVLERIKPILFEGLVQRFGNIDDINKLSKLTAVVKETFGSIIDDLFKQGDELEAMLVAALKSEAETVAARSLGRYTGKGTAEAGGAAAGAAARKAVDRVRLSRIGIYFYNWFIKNVFAGEGLGGVLYVKLAKDFGSSLKKMVTEFGAKPGFVGKFLVLIKNIIPVYFKFVSMMVAGKINVYLNLYTRYYRPVCGARNFKVFAKDIIYPIVLGLLNTLNPYNWFAWFFEEDVVDYGNPLRKLGLYMKSILVTAGSFTFDAVTGNIQFGSKSFICKGYNEKKNLPETFKVAKELQKEVLALEKQFNTKMAAEIAKAEAEMRARVAKEPKEDETKDAFKAAKEATAEINAEFARAKKQLADERRRAVQAARDANRRLREARNRDARRRRAPPPRTPAGTPPAQQGPFLDDPEEEQQQENTNRSLSDYRKDILEERLKKLTIGFTE